MDGIEGEKHLAASNKEWFQWVKGWMVKQGLEQKSSVKLVNNNKC